MFVLYLCTILVGYRTIDWCLTCSRWAHCFLLGFESCIELVGLPKCCRRILEGGWGSRLSFCCFCSHLLSIISAGLSPLLCLLLSTSLCRISGRWSREHSGSSRTHFEAFGRKSIWRGIQLICHFMTIFDPEVQLPLAR